MGWACMGASVPKNGNNRPLSLLLENFSPSFFLALRSSRLLVSWIMSSAGCYRSRADKGEVKERYAGLMSGVKSRQKCLVIVSCWHSFRGVWYIKVIMQQTGKFHLAVLFCPYHKQVRICGETLACDDLHIPVPAWPSLI